MFVYVLAFGFCAGIGGCCAVPEPAAAPVPAPAQTQTQNQTSTSSTTPAPPGVSALVREYQTARDKELPKFSRPDVTADYIARVHKLELTARHAVRVLVQQLDAPGHRPTQDALDDARHAVHALDAALDEDP